MRAGAARYRICGMPPPSSGGIAVLQILALLRHRSAWPRRGACSRPTAVHRFAEAGRLAFADRGRYLGRSRTSSPCRSGCAARSRLPEATRAALIDDARAWAAPRPATCRRLRTGRASDPRRSCPPPPISRSSTRDGQRGGADQLDRGCLRQPRRWCAASCSTTSSPTSPSASARTAGSPPTASSRASGRCPRWRRPWCSTAPRPPGAGARTRPAAAASSTTWRAP
ncbi:MAG: gamma-glutamyltransferase [Comamonadaceae bacterium]|nr:gamma-glutamyltransferase [Comamonadaceae bacterium]